MTLKFSQISKISPNVRDTWSDRIFLTFDIDWAHDDILMDTITLISKASVAATWFVTHETLMLKNIRKIPHQELGIHPNFNLLFDGFFDKSLDVKNITKNLLNIVPEAKSIRSHSMTQSSRLLDMFKDMGLTHEVNHFIPHHTGIELSPWILWNYLCKVPYFWEDDVHILYESIGIAQKNPVELATKKKGGELKVFDFHPIHVFLNTESLDRYERTRPLHHNPKELIKHRYEGYGTRNRLIELLELSKKI